MPKSYIHKTLDDQQNTVASLTGYTLEMRPYDGYPGQFFWYQDQPISWLWSNLSYHKSDQISEMGGNQRRVKFHNHTSSTTSYGSIVGRSGRYYCDHTAPQNGAKAAPYSDYELDLLIKADLKFFSVVNLPPHDIAYCEKVFRGQVIDLPKTLKIDRDPFETDFSIWFPIVDIIQLLIPFYRVNTVAKRVRESSVYAELLEDKPSFTARDFHNHHLGVRFGILPTISDIKATISMIANVFKRYDDYKAKYKDHMNRFHDNRDLPLRSSESFTGNIHMYRQGFDAQYRVVLRHHVSRWHSEAFYTIVVPELGSFISRLKQLVDSFGVLDPAALWDVIPFSFVLDWFFTTNEVMRSLKPRLFQVNYKLWDYLESVAITSQLDTYITAPFADSATTISNSENLVGSTLYRTYARRKFKPPVLFKDVPPKPPDPGSPQEIEDFFKDMDRKIARGVKPPWRSFCVFNRAASAASLIAQRLPR